MAGIVPVEHLPDLLNVAVTMAGGLALFLFGMNIMTRALKVIAGSRLKDILARMTGNRIAGLGAGALVTSIIQSSSITSVLLVGFVSAGLLTLAQSTPVILGANIGTTVTAQILAFKVTALGLPLFTAGFAVSIASSNEVIRQAGRAALGLGLVFFGMTLMNEAMHPLQEYEPFQAFLVSLQNPLLGLLAGAAFTAVIQSSSATTGILIILAGQGMISLQAAIAIAIGANIGTCVTALLATVGRPVEAKRVAMVHVMFNLVGGLVWIFLVDQLAAVATAVSPAHPELSGAARAGAEIPRQIANMHTIFNVINAFIALPFTGLLARIAEKLVPDRKEQLSGEAVPRFLNPGLLETPDLALDAVRQEISRLGELVRRPLSVTMPLAAKGSIASLRGLQKLDHQIDQLHQEIIGYLRSVSLQPLSENQSHLLVSLIRIANDFEHIGDLIATNIVTSATKRIEENVTITEKTAAAISDQHEKVLEAFDGIIAALSREGTAEMTRFDETGKNMSTLVEAIAGYELQRLKADEPRRMATYTREIELVELLDDIFKTTGRIAATLEKLQPQADDGDVRPSGIAT